MNNLLPSPPTLTYNRPPELTPDGPVGRLLVLIPNDGDYAFAARRLAELAHACKANVLFLGLCRDETEELSLRRALVPVSALLQNAGIRAQSALERGMDWVQTVRKHCQVGDMIVCLPEPQTRLLQKQMNQVLRANFGLPIYMLSGAPLQNVSRSNRLAEIGAWAGSLGIVILATFLQIKIISLPQDWAQTTIFALTVIVEFWLLIAWNQWFR